MGLKVVFSKKYTVSGYDHVFRTDKFEKALQTLLKDGFIKPRDIVEPENPSRNDLLLAHTRQWVAKVLSGNISAEEQFRAELLATPEVIEAHLKNTGGTIKAARLALRDGLGINCGGGAHHAYAGHGEGFCLLNDIAVAIKKLQKEKRVGKVLVVDLDVHQGNGTAAIFKNDRTVFTFSIHQGDLYPEKKEKSSLDIELARGCGDGNYLALVGRYLPEILRRTEPELVVYNAGVDIYKGDMLGKLGVSMAGVARRDEIVFKECFKRRIPVVLVLSGGYAAKFSDTVKLHTNTIKTAIKCWKKMWG